MGYSMGYKIIGNQYSGLKASGRTKGHKMGHKRTLINTTGSRRFSGFVTDVTHIFPNLSYTFRFSRFLPSLLSFFTFL